MPYSIEFTLSISCSLERPGLLVSTRIDYGWFDGDSFSGSVCRESQPSAPLLLLLLDTPLVGCSPEGKGGGPPSLNPRYCGSPFHTTLNTVLTLFDDQRV